MILLFLNSFQPDLYRAPFEKNILVMLPILDDVAQSQNNVIYRRYDFFIAKHVEPGRGSVIFSCSCAIFRHNFSNSIPVILFLFYQEQGGFPRSGTTSLFHPPLEAL